MISVWAQLWSAASSVEVFFFFFALLSLFPPLLNSTSHIMHENRSVYRCCMYYQSADSVYLAYSFRSQKLFSL